MPQRHDLTNSKWGILNARLMSIIQEHRTETQYRSQAGRGTLDGIFIARAALQT